MSNSLDPSIYAQYVEIYNNEGRDAASNYVLEECKIDYAAFQRKMRNETQYVFNRRTHKFEEKNEEAQFMSLEDLCNTKSADGKSEISHTTPKKVSFDDIVVDLMRDRLIEISKYIRFDQSAKQVIVDSNGLKGSGYRLTLE